MQLTPCSDGRLKGFFVDLEDYPKIVQYANDHKMLLEIRPVNTANLWFPKLHVTLIPETTLLQDQKIEL